MKKVLICQLQNLEEDEKLGRETQAAKEAALEAMRKAAEKKYRGQEEEQG